MKNNASNIKLRTTLEELAHLGCPADLEVAAVDPGNEDLEIDQIGGICDSHVFQLADNRIGLAALLSLSNKRSRPKQLSEVRLEPACGGPAFELLCPVPIRFSRRTKRGYRAYQFPGGGTIYTQDEVLNQYLIDRRLPANCSLERWVFAIGGPMPAHLRHGQWFDVRLTLVGADGTEYSCILRLWTQRPPLPAKSGKPRQSLFANVSTEPTQISANNPTAPSAQVPHQRLRRTHLSPKRILRQRTAERSMKRSIM
jgi:hypothetical protein